MDKLFEENSLIMIGYAAFGVTVVVLLVLLILYSALKWYIRGPKYTSRRRLSGETIILTGGTSGIGKETAKELSMRGARLILACRDVKVGQELAGDIKGDTQGEVEVEECNLASFASIKRFCAKVLETESRVNTIIYCAGVQGTPNWKTVDGYDYQLAVNYISQYLMTFLLLPVIKHSAPGSRIINISCYSHRKASLDLENIFSCDDTKKYSSRRMAALSKLCVVLHSAELARRLEGSGVSVYCVNPGPCNTSLGRYTRETSGIFLDLFYKAFYWPFLRKPKNGAQTVIYCAVEESIKEHTGLYYEDCREGVPSEEAFSYSAAQSLWTSTESMLGLR